MFDNTLQIFTEITLTDYEKEQLENWEFQGAEYYIHTKKAEEKNTLEKRVCTLGDRSGITATSFKFVSSVNFVICVK